TCDGRWRHRQALGNQRRGGDVGKVGSHSVLIWNEIGYDTSALPNLNVVPVQKLLSLLRRGFIIGKFIALGGSGDMALIIYAVKSIFGHDAPPRPHRLQRSSPRCRARVDLSGALSASLLL